MAKMGRPKVESPKHRTLSVRVDDLEYEKLKNYAARHNMTITQVLHKGIDIQYQMEKAE